MIRYNIERELCTLLAGVGAFSFLYFMASPNQSVLQIRLFPEYVMLKALKYESKIIDHIHLATFS